MTVSGNPTALEHYDGETVASINTWMQASSDFGPAMLSYNQAPSDLPHTIVNHQYRMVGHRTALRRISRSASAFARALRTCDRIVGPMLPGVVAVADDQLFDALLAAWTADPDASNTEAMNTALDQITGSPDQLADEFAGIVADLDVGPDEIEDLQQDLRVALDQVTQEASHSQQPWPSESELADRAWERVRLLERWDEIPVSIGNRLADATSKLDRRADDPAYTEEFFDALGPENALALAETAAIVAWNDVYAQNGTTPSTRHTVEVVSEALATASPGLGRDYVDQLVELGLTEEHEDTNGFWPGGGRDYLELNDALPLLLSSGDFSTEYSEVIGQLGIDVLAGENADGTDIDVDKGIGSPFMDGFENLETAWQGRGVVLVDAAARDAGAANTLLQNDRNAELLTDDQFVWRERTMNVDLETDWDVVGSSVRNLITAGAVDFADTDPVAAREAAANVIEFSTAEGPGSAADALAPAYGEILTHYLGELGDSTPIIEEDQILPPSVRDDGRMFVQTFTAAQFAALAMTDEATRADIVAARDRLVPVVAVTGMEYDLPRWKRRIATIDAIVATGLNGEEMMSAEEAARLSREHNANIDLARDSLLAFLPTDKIPGPVDPLVSRGIDELTEEFLHRPTDQVDRAEYQVDLTTEYILGSQQSILAEAGLVVAVRAAARGDATPGDMERIQITRDGLGDDYVDALLASASGEDVAIPTPSPEDQAIMARDADFDLIADIVPFTVSLTRDNPRRLFP